MNHHISLEQKIVRITGSFINMSVDKIDSGIIEALCEIGNYLDVDRVYLSLFDKEENLFRLCQEWSKPSLPPITPSSVVTITKKMTWFYTQLLQGYDIYVPDTREILLEIQEASNHWQFNKVKSLLLLPIKAEDETKGYVGIESASHEKPWTPDVVDLLKIFGDILFSAVERRRIGDIRRAHMQYLQHMDRINQVLLGTADINDMLPELMEVVGEIFNADRVWLQYPCNPHAFHYEIRAEYAHPDFPGVYKHQKTLPANADARSMMRTALNYANPVAYDPHTGRSLLENQLKHQVRSSVNFALRPRLGEPWLFGMHQCDHARIWKQEEKRLFRDIGLRLTDALNILLLNENLQKSEHRFRSVLESNPDLIFIFDRSGRCYDVIPRNHALLFEPVEDILNLTIAERLPPKESETACYYIGKALDEHQVQTFDFKVLRAPKDTWLSVRVAPFEYGDNPTVLLSCRDVSDLKHAEEERKNMEAQIQHAQKLESLGVLAGGIAHDFNNLLMGILGNADMALTDLPSHSTVRPYLDDVIKSSQRAAELCRQMLAYSGKGRFVVQPVNLSDVVEEMAHLLEVSISKKAILRYDFAKSIPYIQADATQIRQVVMNLITNASDAIGDKSGIITVATGAMECDRDYLRSTFLDDTLADGVYVYIEVSDTGCGMDEATQNRLFEPFFTTKFTGRGLGMSATLGIVRGHKGAIKCYSEVGRGTTFKILFPVCDTAFLPSDVSSQTMLETPGSGTILVVDDEETIRAIARKMLEQAGYDVITASDGKEGVDLFELHKAEISLVLLDMTMPHMSGPQVFEKIIKIQPGIKVILSSGYSKEEVTSHFDGLAGFIQKPYLGSELLNTVRQVLQNNT